jgi:hypothetical protein
MQETALKRQSESDQTCQPPTPMPQRTHSQEPPPTTPQSVTPPPHRTPPASTSLQTVAC